MLRQDKHLLPLILLAAIGAADRQPLMAAEMSVEDAWKALPKYEYGQDMARAVDHRSSCHSSHGLAGNAVGMCRAAGRTA